MLFPLLPTVLDPDLWASVDESCLPNREAQSRGLFAVCVCVVRVCVGACVFYIAL